MSEREAAPERRYGLATRAIHSGAQPDPVTGARNVPIHQTTAYVFDDALMVTIAVVTLGQHRLQERGGRWLKLLSGAVILVLGAMLLLAPEMLVF